MKIRLIINDLKENRLVSIATVIFMTVTAMLLALSILLFARLSDAIDSLMTKAETPDFLQMHTGDIDASQINGFVRQRDDVEKMQLCTFLNLQNSRLSIGGKSLEGNTQDNGLCCQSEAFDYLLDPENNPIQPAAGEVYIPVCYRKEYGIESGALMRIGTEKLTVAGFLRDSQMNSMMASSKRFLVHRSDYERLKPLGSEEYLIEFRLKEGSDVNSFATAYKDAKLPENGPTITYPLIKMMNALSDGIMILVILLLSFVMLFISMLYIRYIILTQLEKDKREIGMLRAVGISRKDIRALYLSKYLLLSVFGCIAGIILAMLLSEPLGTRMRELYGDAGNTGLICILMILGSICAEALILLSVSRTLGKTEKLTALEALYGQDNPGRKKNLWLPVGIITAATVFMILVPWNLKNTLEAPDFVTYMGIGNSQIRIDVRQTDDIGRQVRALTGEIKQDQRVESFTLMQTGSYKTILPSGASYNLMIENGDHGSFPVSYIEGRYPEGENEIALSILNAEEMNVKAGDTVIVCRDTGNGETEKNPCTVCGIYSDITNGGKTAKACMNRDGDLTPVMWSILYVSLTDESFVHEWVSEYQNAHSSSGEGIRVTMISEYLKEIYGQTIRNIRNASIVAAVLAGVILFVVLLLFIRLVIWRERKDCSLKKALGYTSSDIRREYLIKLLLYIIPGIALGLFTGIVPGAGMAGMLLGSMGARGFHYIIDPLSVFVSAPALIAFTAMCAAAFSLTEIHNIRAYECLYTEG
ncbi:MAG: ABC transporter permease [Lachnospiraceae bacterium]|nr:ABC transporter permease [Lachnospiraceae bacterium]